MKSCELCKSPAKIYCDSDQASLCWTCDSKVHSANFLVARHSRNLLCRVCHSPTPWTAAGEKLGPSTVSFCQKCVVDGREESVGINNNINNNDDDDDDDDDEEYDGDEDDETELELEDEDENQVVPLSNTSPPAASSSSSSDYSSPDRSVLIKRKRVDEADASEEDDVECSSVRKKQGLMCEADSSEAIGGNKRTLYHFMPLNSEGMGRHRDKISGKNNTGVVIDECEATRTVGLDLNSSDS